MWKQTGSERQSQAKQAKRTAGENRTKSAKAYTSFARHGFPFAPAGKSSETAANATAAVLAHGAAIDIESCMSEA